MRGGASEELPSNHFRFSGNVLNAFIGRCEHIIADRRILEIAVSKRILVQPLDDNVGSLQHPLPLDPGKEVYVDVEVLVVVSQHDDPRLCNAVWHWNCDDVTQPD